MTAVSPDSDQAGGGLRGTVPAGTGTLSSIRVAARLARREMRGGFRGFRIFLACLTLGVAALAAIGSLSSAIVAGLKDDARAIVGGDVQVRVTGRTLAPEQQDYIHANAAAVTVVTGHRRVGEPDVDWRALARVGGTIVILMGVAQRAVVADELIAGGLPAETPFAAIHRATTEQQEVIRGETSSEVLSYVHYDIDNIRQRARDEHHHGLGRVQGPPRHGPAEQDVDRAAHLPAHAACGNAPRPPHHRGLAHAAFEILELVTAQRQR